MKFYIQAIMLSGALGLFGAVYSMEQSKEPTDYYEITEVTGDSDDTEWVFRAYNGQNLPRQFAQQAQQQEQEVLDTDELES